MLRKPVQCVARLLHKPLFGTRIIPADARLRLEVLPEEEFFIGDLMTVGRYNVVITQIKTTDGMARRGSVLARDIVRIYAKKARTTYS